MKRMLTLVAVVVALASQTLAGFSYRAVTTAQQGDRRAREVTNLKAVVDGDSARLEFTRSANPNAPRDGYLVTRDGGKTLYMVNPREKTYMVWDIGQLANMAGSIMEATQGLVSMTVTDPQVKKLSEGSGPKLLGYSTRHTKYQTSYTMNVSVMGMRNETKIATVEDIWSTTQLDDAGFGVWKQAMSFKTGIEDIDTLLETQKQKLQGFPLKTVTVSTTTDKRGKSETQTTTMEITELKPFTAPASLFEIPAGYREEKLEIPLDAPGQDAPQDNPGLKGLMKLFGR